MSIKKEQPVEKPGKLVSLYIEAIFVFEYGCHFTSSEI